MPAKKPTSISKGHIAHSETAGRESAEAAMTPKTALTSAVPISLRGKTHSVAAATWKKAIKLYSEVDGIMATAFDENLLVMYCKVEEEIPELEEMRRQIILDWVFTRKEVSKIKSNTPENIKAKAQLWNVVNALHARLQGMDARLDGKRKLSHTLEMSLYLTPRSRAGVAPPEKEQEDTSDPMAELLKEG